MYRLLAKIIEIKKIGLRKKKGFLIYTLSLKVRVKDIIPKIKLPHIKGRILWVARDYPHSLEPKIDDEIVIYPEEICRIIPGNPCDVSRDAIILKNQWMDVTILPHLGGRISSIIYKDRDYFQSSLAYHGKGWADVGGAFDLLDGNLPGNLWNAEFEPKKKSKTRCVLFYDKKGLSVKKEYELHTSLPLLTEKTGIEVKKKREITYCKYIPIAINDIKTMLFVPTQEKLQHRVYQRSLTFAPWHPYEYYGVKIGSFLVTDDKGCFLYTTTPGKIEVVKARYSHRSFNIYPGSQKKELKKGESFSYTSAYAVGDEYKVTGKLIAVKADIQKKSCLLLRGDDKFDGKLRWKGKDIDLKPLEIKGIGKLWVY